MVIMDPITQRLAAAMKIHEAGRLTEAEALYRGVLAEAPQQAHALHLLGVLVHQQGRHDEAAELLTRALAVHGPHAIFLSNLAAIYLDLNRLDDTIAHARTALQMEPYLSNAHNNLGVALMRQGHYEDAIAAFAEAIRLQPMHIEARCNHSASLHRLGRLQEALAGLREAVRMAPQYPQVQNDLGGVLMALDQSEQAITHLRAAIRLKPAFAEAHSNLGLALRDVGRLDEALECFRTSMRLNPKYAGAHNNLAYTLEFLGKIDEARTELHASLALDPDNARALAGLSALAANGHGELSDDQVARIRTLVTRADLSIDDRGRLNFALGRVLDKEGRYDEAFAHYHLGNELRKTYVTNRGATFDRQDHRGWIDRLIATFTPAYFERVRSFGMDSELPIFVLGMMRSGTTLTEQILASHPLVHGAGELQYLGLLVMHLPERLQTEDVYPECMTRLEPMGARILAERHLQQLHEHGQGALRVVDKMPANFLHLGLIATLFPRAKIIHCRRDPVDTCLSCYFQNFGQPQPFTLDLADLGFYYREYERLMEHWRRVLPLPIFEMPYEELTADPETYSRRMIDFCGLDWDERCLRFHETERPVRTASVLQVRKPIYRTAVGRWKRYEKHLQPLLDVLQRPSE
jgi:tetratricopeptide (TPR) repeat protein